ncbi:MAG TPA: ABC transporter ATP-binding protein [Phycisphaerales bacterium]|nr:ABC transporter ATP-binding protein [Phycisphaerales bacterium]
MTQPTSAPVPIQAERLSRRFGGRAALHNVSFTVERGTTCGLIGLNGAGKSTFIRAAVGLLPPSGGVVRLNGVDVWQDRLSAIRTLGYVPDRPHTYPWMRVAQAVDFAAKAWGAAWNAPLAAALLRQYRLDPRQRCGRLSKGQGAKLSLLLALAHDPAILILDEPTDGLDPIARDDFLQQVLESTLTDSERSQGRTVLISSHALGELQRLTDTVAILHQGSLIAHAPTAELLSNTKRLRVVLDAPGEPGAAPAGVICQQRRGREWTLTVGG